MNSLKLYEAYAAVYDDNLRFQLDEISSEFSGIEYLSDEEIDIIVEETIDEMLDEGYDFDEVEEIFEEILFEARRNMDDRSARRREYMKSSEKAAKEAQSRAAQVSRKEKRAEKIAQVKSAVKSALGRAKAAVKSGVSKAKESGREAKFQAVDKRIASYANKRNLHPAAGAAARSKDPEKRRGLRSRVAADIKGRIKKKIAQAQVDTAAAARRAGDAATDLKNRSVQSIKNKAAIAKRGATSAVGKVARRVASGADRVASKLGEDFDVYDLVLEHLIENEYTNSIESAEKIMINMSENWRNLIIDEYREISH